MRGVQVIGLPGVGKTTGINRFLEQYKDLDISFLDIRNFKGTYREQSLQTALNNTMGPWIAESACGIKQIKHPHYVIRLNIDIKEIYSRLNERNDQLSDDYLSILSEAQIPIHYEVNSTEQLIDLLTELFTQ